ncbi:MAG: ATP-binding cassette domain-containing protein [Intrasporangium sp.]|uniref:ATP-binding cassette domain-containing protein n=1 Tax=Intrasporangium sp. TaxID=1925024 RepID=UPI002649D5FB|nr:ATP-binding cassette domain-containing protein [Intrasporangium sp.]MDN5794433.1 ATP-binding cassette domain-containing protein [Intrasporangium sp.]
MPEPGPGADRHADRDAGRPVEVRGLTKRYGEHEVLRGVDLSVEAGSVLALLGHNGAGKTTLVHVLSTLQRLDGGMVRVGGHDVVAAPERVRSVIALVGQSSAVDELLSGRANLVMLARLSGLTRAAATRRAAELLADLALDEAADRRVDTYSGGMRRRLDLAAALITRPDVLFLDEPTTGVDPTTRAELWDAVRSLTDLGVAVLLTTQYLDEAEALADHVVVLDHGRVIATGAARDVAALAGGKRLLVTVSDPAETERAAALLGRLATEAPVVDPRRGTVSFTPADPLAAVASVASALDAADLAVHAVTLREPSLEEAFAHLTSSAPVGEEPAGSRAAEHRAAIGAGP